MGKRILIAVGGTGGHLFPAQSLAKDLGALYKVELLFVGGGLSTNKCFEKNSFAYQDISCSSLSLNLGIFKGAGAIFKGILQSVKMIKKYNPDLVIAFGSFHTLPTLIAALLFRKKIYLHEQNKVMGRINRLFAKFAKKLLVTFPKTTPEYPKKSILVKMPLKFNTVGILTKSNSRAELNLDPDVKTILICGGSQGAKSINRAFLDSLDDLEEYSFQVIHMLGDNENLDSVKRRYSEKGIKAYVRAFDPNMHHLMQASDFMIGRAGASTIAEIMEIELPAILIPYPYASGHQEHNADFVDQEVRGGFKLLEGDLKGNFLAKLIVSFFNDENIKEYRHYMRDYKTKVLSEDFVQIISKDLSLEEKR